MLVGGWHVVTTHPFAVDLANDRVVPDIFLDRVFELRAHAATLSRSTTRSLALRARGLRSIIEEVMLDVMYDLPSQNNLARVVVVPLTSNTQRLYPGEAAVTVNGQSSKAMADQIMAADKTRLKTQLGSLSRSDLIAVENAIKVHLGLPK